MSLQHVCPFVSQHLKAGFHYHRKTDRNQKRRALLSKKKEKQTNGVALRKLPSFWLISGIGIFCPRFRGAYDSACTTPISEVQFSLSPIMTQISIPTYDSVASLWKPVFHMLVFRITLPLLMLSTNLPSLIRPRQNKEICSLEHYQGAYLSPMFPSFDTRMAKLGNIREKYARWKCFWKHGSSFCQEL